MESKLPKNWVDTELMNLCSVYTGKKDANFATKSGEYNFFTCAYKPLKSDSYSFEGDVLILPGNGVNVGEVFYFSGKFEAYQRTYIINDIKIDPRYLFYHFSRFWRELGSLKQFGSATNYIKIGNFKDYKVQFPPLAEQQRIVAKLDTLFGSLDALKIRLNNIPQLIKNFKQAVLTQAVTGKITQEWRVGKELEDTLFNVDLNNYLTDIKYGTSKKSDYDIDGMPILRIPNIKNGEIDTSDLKFSILDEKEYQKVLLKKGDILIIRSNGSVSIVGKTAIIKNDKEFGYAGYLIRLRTSDNLNSKYLNYILSSPSLRKQIEEKARSTSGVNNINTTEIKELKINVFDIKEQTEIVKRVENLFSKADAIENQYKTLKEKIERLPQAILAKAFKGELVAQLPTDGDAKDLLEEIKKLKESLVVKPKKKVVRNKK
ncbi:restriction endonuclease subunit S [Tenacibaculum finnmarkense]|uniref:restriction endonuclease subunit S n=1 Tax=Tenacibaculum finnmarkense TaxID=2781243 RepID=UPI001E656B15|nr:restriction endonuclease subunit S [Tenacibaculum finnmarkense]MCD8402764.1 restriction endonuclease subunit S [Tenacibaculum finnmarkense genomovar finnmarkense]